MQPRSDPTGLIDPVGQIAMEVPDRIRFFGHKHRKHGYLPPISKGLRADQMEHYRSIGAIVHEFFMPEWLEIERALEDAFAIGKMKPWTVIAFRHSIIKTGSNYHPYLHTLVPIGLLVFSREKDWIAFKLCL